MIDGSSFLQPAYGPDEYNLLPEVLRRQVLDMMAFQSEEAREAEERAQRDDRIRAQEDYAYEREEGLRRARMRREQEQIDGSLAPEAELFRDGRLRPRITEAHDFQPQPRVPVVEDLFFRDSLTWVAGPSGTFKSFVTADLAFRYGTGGMDYHGLNMTSGRALLVVAEGANGYALRKVAWEKEHGREVKNVSIYPAPLQLGDTLKEMPALISYLKEEDEAGRPFTLILFDTQAMCTAGVDENASEMNQVINVLHQLREVSGACVMVVHHFGKDKRAGMRGSSMIYAAADTVCVLKRKEDALDVTLSTSQADEGKQKDAETRKDLLTLEMKAHVVGEGYFDSKPVTSLVPVRADGRSADTHTAAGPVALPAVTDIDGYYLRGIGTYEEDGASPSSLRERLEQPEYVAKIPRPPHNVTRTTAGNRLQELRKKGLTEPVPGSKGKWRVTPLGNSVIAQLMIDRLATEADWSDRHARRGKFRGPNTSGSELFDLGSPPQVNQSGEPNEPKSELGPDLRELK